MKYIPAGGYVLKIKKKKNAKPSSYSTWLYMDMTKTGPLATEVPEMLR